MDKTMNEIRELGDHLGGMYRKRDFYWTQYIKHINNKIIGVHYYDSWKFYDNEVCKFREMIQNLLGE